MDQFSSSFYTQLIKFVPFSLQERALEYLKGALSSKVLVPGQNDLFIAVFYNFVFGGKQQSTVATLDKILFAKENLHFAFQEIA